MDHQARLRKRSRNICHICAVVFYIVFMVGTYGSGYMFFFFATMQTGVFLTVYALVYLPARTCVERFINTNLSKTKRNAFLFQAQKELASFQELYRQNSLYLNEINDTVFAENGLNSLYYHAPSGEITFQMDNEDSSRLLESYEFFSLEEKESLQNLLTNISQGQYSIAFEHDSFQIKYGNYVDVCFFKPADTSVISPSWVSLDDHWFMYTFVEPRPM